jgi:hypothetical protein
MKYLKKFESYSEDLFYRISPNEFIGSRENKIWFEKSEIDYIQSFASDDTSILTSPEMHHLKIEFKKRNEEIYIHKLEDEWYLIQIRKWDEKNPGENPTNWRTFGKDFNLYEYKCDTFDGLKQLLNKLLSRETKKKSKFFRNEDFNQLMNRFESFGWSQFIDRLDQNRFINLTKNRRFISLDSNDKKFIQSLGYNVQFDIRCDKSDNKMTRIDVNGYEFLLYKDTDDWFFVVSGKNIYDPNYVFTISLNFHPSVIARFTKRVHKLFRCDQLEGLKRLIDEYKEHKDLKNESLFNQRMGDKLWAEFDSTHEPYEAATGEIVGSPEFNGMKDFRNHHKKITPTRQQIDEAISLFNNNIKGVFSTKYYPEWRQLYINMWDDEKQYSYAESEKLNKTKVIINFYDSDWIFVALCKEDQIETHFVCDDIEGLNQWVLDHKKKIEKR